VQTLVLIIYLRRTLTIHKCCYEFSDIPSVRHMPTLLLSLSSS